MSKNVDYGRGISYDKKTLLQKRNYLKNRLGYSLTNTVSKYNDAMSDYKNSIKNHNKFRSVRSYTRVKFKRSLLVELKSIYKVLGGKKRLSNIPLLPKK